MSKCLMIDEETHRKLTLVKLKTCSKTYSNTIDFLISFYVKNSKDEPKGK
ncbi:MAG: hypothetical protein QW531_04645 [Thermoplasmata archaeon]